MRLLRKEACYCRLTPAEKDGSIKHVLYANWRQPVADREDIEVIDLLDINSPWRDLAVRMGRTAGDDGKKKVRTKSRKFAVLTRVPTPDSTYYPIPYYAALFKGHWYNIKQLIGMAKEAKLKNIAPIKYQIEISNKYWDSIFKSEGITDRREQQKRIVKEKQQILDFLTGVENAGKVWFSTFYVAPTGEVQHEVVINKIDSDKEGGDWSTDIQEAVNMICFTMRVHSNLVGSVPGKSQTNNSGSDKRELYTIAQALQKPYHDLLFTVHQIIIRFNGWTGAYPDCPFIQLTLLSEPKVQTMKSFKASGLAKFCNRLTNAPAIEPNIKPTINRLTLFVTRLLTASTNSSTADAPITAATGMLKAENWILNTPIIVSNATPRDAPDETPNVYGPANGLRKRVCMIRPAIESDAPARIAVIAFGRRIA